MNRPTPAARNARPTPAKGAPPPAALLAGALLAGALLLVAGCGIFTPEDPPDPSTGGSLPLPSLLESPDSALFSLELGVENRNLQFYAHALAESTSTADETDFHATFDVQDTLDFIVSTGSRPPADWRSQEEKTFFPLFAGLRPVGYQMYLFPDPERPDQRGPDETSFFRRYRVWAGGDPLAVGLADFVVRRIGVNREWKIVRWVDRRDTTEASVRSMGRRRLDSLSR